MESSDQTFPKIHALTLAQLEGTLAPSQLHELESLLLESADTRRAYIEYIEESACLRWHCAERLPELVEVASAGRGTVVAQKPRRMWNTIVYGGGLACLLAVAVGAWGLFPSPLRDDSDMNQQVVAAAPIA